MTDYVSEMPPADGLAAHLSGQLLSPGDDGYEEARRVWNGMYDRRPALISRCARTADVVAAIGFAREQGLTVAVRGGAHSAQGYGTCDGGLVIDLSPMKQIEVDPQAQTVRAQAGLTWGEFDAATQEHGLAITGGRFSTTGVAGLTLGSGSGWLERKCGLTADNLLEAELVTADGRVLTVSADENAELFWGLRGGGGNFGIVTSFLFHLHEAGPTILGGMLVSLPERAAEITRFMRDYMRDAPRDLGAGVGFVSAPPEPFVPAEMHFKPIVGTIICWTGSMEEGEQVLAPIREAAQPVVDIVQPMPYVALQSMLDAGGPTGTRAYMKAGFLDELSDTAIDKLTAHGINRASPMSQLILEPCGGAIADVGEHETALGRRQVRWCFHALAFWTEPDEAAAEANVAWARELADDLEPHTTAGVYLNYTSDVGEDRVRAAYGDEKYERLVALKDDYDPTNLFQLNQNIRPSAQPVA
jgi:FAD/FMN-containing dehydrogenase